MEKNENDIAEKIIGTGNEFRDHVDESQAAAATTIDSRAPIHHVNSFVQVAKNARFGFTLAGFMAERVLKQKDERASAAGNSTKHEDNVQAPALVERYGQYTTDYDTDTSVKRIKTLRHNVVSNTAV